MNKYFIKGKKIIVFYIIQNLIFVFQEEFLKKFPSNDIYKKLNNNNDITNEYDYYCRFIKILFHQNQEIYDLCRKFARNLKNISTILNDIDNDIDRCRYINFWKNDQINKNCNTSNIVRNIQRIRTNFITVAYRINNESSIDKCFKTYRGDISLESWKKWKDLYDYVTNKDKIQNIIDSDDYLCNIYSNYFSYIKNIYEKYKEECCPGTNGKCPAHINISEWCTQENFLIDIQCNKPAQIGGFSAEITQDLEAHSGAEDEEEEKKPDKTVSGEADGVGVGPRGAKQEIAEGKESVGPASNSQDDMLVYAIGSGSGSSEAKEELPNAVISNSTGTVIGTSLGFVIPLITIYRVKKNIFYTFSCVVICIKLS
ncbi:hypothetical protein PVBG_05725 [Plasmodium vivax Brazil I]|uniref:Variable surface protein Vir24 n=1 Tax=Plasmodium vivax (strain Brazil I) TaxID=1033975 RepID=A0A0J9SK37_PLAV1|nr:hypothetical protein PVBG_05725 [Plasmodium vivax Brazil I]